MSRVPGVVTVTIPDDIDVTTCVTAMGRSLFILPIVPGERVIHFVTAHPARLELLASAITEAVANNPDTATAEQQEAFDRYQAALAADRAMMGGGS